MCRYLFLWHGKRFYFALVSIFGLGCEAFNPLRILGLFRTSVLCAGEPRECNYSPGWDGQTPSPTGVRRALGGATPGHHTGLNFPGVPYHARKTSWRLFPNNDRHGLHYLDIYIG